jgi:tripartite-type tricarboxylate transporter receptor subunit TctC
LEGTVQVASVALPAAEQLVRAGKLTGLAVTGAKRWFDLPDVPTMIESGYPGFVSETFNALFAPAGTPPEIIALLAAQCREAFASEKAKQITRNAGFEIVVGTPEQLTARLAAEIPAVKALVARAGLQLQ